MIFAVFILARNNMGEIALVTRDNNKIGLPGGKVDRDENICQTALRESKEEGWNLKLIDNKPFHTQIIDGKICAWIKGEIIGKFLDYKEKSRGIKPFYGNIGQLATSGFNNEVALHKYFHT